jgi:hypothetical protein
MAKETSKQKKNMQNVGRSVVVAIGSLENGLHVPYEASSVIGGIDGRNPLACFSSRSLFGGNSGIEVRHDQRAAESQQGADTP